MEFYELKAAIQEIAKSLVEYINLQFFAHELVRTQLVTQSTMESCFEERDEAATARRLLSAVADTIRVSPKEFSKFISVLDQEPALAVARNKLVNTYVARGGIRA
eukprot:Em0007g1467a